MKKETLKLLSIMVAAAIIVLIGAYYWIYYPELVKTMLLVFGMFWDIFVGMVTFNTFTFVIFILCVVLAILRFLYSMKK